MAADPTVSGLLRRLQRKPAKELTDEEIALRCGVEFCVAVAAVDGPRLGALLDAPGYQALPIAGELPEEAVKPLTPTELYDRIKTRTPLSLLEMPAECFAVRSRDSVQSEFAAVAAWMLPQDLAVVLEPEPGVDNWLQRRGCVIVRLRARRPYLVAGNLLEALTPRP